MKNISKQVFLTMLSIPFFADTCRAENYVPYWTDRGITQYVDMDAMRLVAKGKSLVYVTEKGVHANQESDGVAYYIVKRLMDCSRQYYRQISVQAFTADNVPLILNEEQTLDDAINDALIALDSKASIGSVVGDDVHRLCLTVSRWVFEYSKRSDARTLVELASKSSSIPLSKEGGVYHIKATINGEIPLKFVVDSGAADVVLPEYVAQTLFANGSLERSDILGKSTYTFADGGTKTGTVINLKSITIGNVTIKNIRASILSGDNTALLLGQSALKNWGNGV
jgi:clan AA aspartic protease (TIGR02281 family)